MIGRWDYPYGFCVDREARELNREKNACLYHRAGLAPALEGPGGIRTGLDDRHSQSMFCGNDLVCSGHRSIVDQCRQER